ncbi:phosphotransferase family protein [Niveomyces insectorum RCEF 264]|uniref:Phosphotransferase family protein n=1 Tax=Niveomyces insectorum RCEF 264 TaxID=1081102 RepID=A0A167VMR9_9HYPO|nr:phosphotransferase family protein [Niveomyces insectorum RCEF 264]
MPPSFELYDDDAWDRGEAIWLAWKKKLFDRDVYRQVAATVRKHRLGTPVEVCAPKKGAFNVHYRVKFADGGSAIIRFPIPGYFRFAEEKLRAGVAVMRYVAEHTSIPVPFVFYLGTAEESPGKLGPFIVMEYIEHHWDLCDVLVTPGTPIEVKPVLNPNIDEALLDKVYGQMADILLQLASCTFDKIGCPQAMLPSDDDAGGDSPFDITSRPFTFNLAQLGEVGGCPPWALPDATTTYATASDYYTALADMHLLQLTYQRNGAVESADDARKKYVARHLFRRWAAERRRRRPCRRHLITADDPHAPAARDAGPFPLWCDDLRPSNVLLDKDCNVVGVVDWEFSYAAPADFACAPPWWLLLTMPEEWKAGLDDWVPTYAPRLEVFLRALEKREEAAAAAAAAVAVQTGHDDHAAKDKDKDKNTTTPLSVRMRRSWEAGEFWVSYAARKTWAFDGIYWRFLDERFWGPGPTASPSPFLDRLALLPADDAAAMEAFVERKLREKEERTLVDWYALEAADTTHGGSATMKRGAPGPSVIGSNTIASTDEPVRSSP